MPSDLAIRKCAAKVRMSREGAEKAAESLKYKASGGKRARARPARAYECDVCGYWHTTSKP